MGYEGHDNSRDVADKEQKHPWEIFPEDDSANSKKKGGKKKRVKTEEQRTKEKERRDKRKAKLNSLKAWILKNRVLSVGMLLAVIVLVIGTTVLISRVVKENEIAQLADELEDIEQLRIPDEFSLEEVVTPDYAYTIVRAKLSEALKDIPFESGGTRDSAKLEDTIDDYIKNSASEENKPAFELVKIVYLAGNKDTTRAEELMNEFDEKNYTIGKNLRYIYIMTKMCYYVAVGNNGEMAKWREALNEEYLSHQVYLDEETYEAIDTGYSTKFFEPEEDNTSETEEEEE